MKFMMLKKFALSIVLLILMSSSITFAQSNNYTVDADSEYIDSIDDNLKIIAFIDNTKGNLVIYDDIYHLKLNTKVYDQGKRITNRYALKKGQRVDFEVSFEGSKRYLDNIFILDK